MAAILYTLFNFKVGKDWQQVSDEESSAAHERWHALKDKWKEDPAIEYVCRYINPGKYHSLLFRVDSVEKFTEMGDSFYRLRNPLEWHNFELVIGNTEEDDYWTS